ncbi:MAG: sodium:solute symporter family protein, partial [Bacteroidales bacterium]
MITAFKLFINLSVIPNHRFYYSIFCKMLITFIVLYLVITVGIGVYASKKIRTGDDYVNAGRNLPFFFNSFALFAMWYGAETIFGAAGRFMESGLIGVIEEPLGAALCLVLFGAFLAKPLYKRNILTIADLFKEAYGDKIEFISSCFMLVTYIGYIAAQMVALGILLKLIIGLELSTGILISSAVVTAYTFAGGMWAVSITDFFQSIMIVLGLCVLCFTLITQIGGLEVVLDSAPKGFFNILPEKNAESINEWVTAWMVIGLGSLASQDIFQRVNSAKNVKVAVRSTYFGAGMYLFFSIIPMLIALCVRIMDPARVQAGTSVDFQEIIPQIAVSSGNPFVQILFLGALVSAILSTCSGALLAPSAILAENIMKPLLEGRTKRKLDVWMVRLSVVIMSVVSTVLAMSENDIYAMVGDSGVLALTSILVPTFYAIYSKRPSRAGAMGAMFIGAIAWASKEYASYYWKAYEALPVSAWIIGG